MQKEQVQSHRRMHVWSQFNDMQEKDLCLKIGFPNLFSSDPNI